MKVPEELYYTKEHEWVDIEDMEGDQDGLVTVGISDYAQESLGDITFIELPAVGEEFDQFGEFASIESVKAASDIFTPVSGEVVEVNTALEEDPSLINKSPYKKGWIARLRMTDKEELSNLMTADEYRKFLESVG